MVTGLDALSTAVAGTCSELVVYNLVLGLGGLARRAPPPAAAPRPLEVIVPAHDEARVILDVLTSLEASRYPRERFRVTVLCDHCTDRTAELARGAGAHVVVRDSGPRGKQHAIAWYLRHLTASGELTLFAGVVVVDADNLVDPDLLQALSDHLAAGAAAVQAKLDTRNPEAGWIARSYAASYWAANLTVQRSRAVLGLSAQLGGTGMAIAADTLRAVPFQPTTLVDDLQYTLQLVLTGRRVAYCEVGVFDEKPMTMRASVRQRTRWMRGQALCIALMAWPLLRRAVSRFDFVALDQLLMLFNPIAMVMTLLYFLAVLPRDGWAGLVLWAGVNTALNLLWLWRAGVPVRLWRNIVPSMAFSFSWVVPVLWGFLTCSRTGWTHTEHFGAGMRPAAASRGGVTSA